MLQGSCNSEVFNKNPVLHFRRQVGSHLIVSSPGPFRMDLGTSLSHTLYSCLKILCSALLLTKPQWCNLAEEIQHNIAICIHDIVAFRAIVVNKKVHSTRILGKRSPHECQTLDRKWVWLIISNKRGIYLDFAKFLNKFLVCGERNIGA